MKLPELPAVLKLQVVLKTLAVPACLLVGVLLVAWGLAAPTALWTAPPFRRP